MYKHQCPKKPDNDGAQSFLKVCRKTLPEAIPIASINLREKILAYMNSDDRYFVIINDELILKFENQQIDYHFNNHEKALGMAS